MKQSDLQLRIPAGTKDLLPGEAWRKRRLETDFAGIFYGWGYREVVTPTFEYYQALATGNNGEHEENLVKFLDRQGQILAMRPDMTTPIARLVATRMKDSAMPLRLFYLANVFSHSETQVGRSKEFFQAGVEFVGAAGPEADGEVIALAVELLTKSGLRNFQIHLGQMAVFHGVLQEIGLDEQGQRRFKNTLANKDFVGLREVLADCKVASADQVRVMELLSLRGGREVLDKAALLVTGDTAKAGLVNLQEVLQVLEDYGVAEQVVVDFSILRGFEYYTGVIFEAYAQHLGFPLFGGGRYDNLIDQFGFTAPATGFAVGLERIMLALSRQGEVASEPLPDVLIVYVRETRKKAIQKATQLRAAGQAVELLLIEANQSNQAGAAAEARGIKKVISLLPQANL